MQQQLVCDNIVAVATNLQGGTMEEENKKCDSIGKFVSEIYRNGNSFFSKAYAKYNIGAGQYQFLRVLYRVEGITQEELSNILNIDKATTARALKKLESEGYIYRKKCIDDKRANKIGLTQKALDIKEDFLQVLKEWEKKITSILSEEERCLILSLLEKLATSEVLRRDQNE